MSKKHLSVKRALDTIICCLFLLSGITSAIGKLNLVSIKKKNPLLPVVALKPYLASQLQSVG